MKNLLNLCFLLVLVVGCAEARYRVKKPFLYEVSKGRFQAFLFGTIHRGVAAEDLPASVWKALEESDAFVSEVDFEKDSAKVEEATRERLFRTEDEPLLSEILDKDTYKLLVELMSKELSALHLQTALKRFSLMGATAFVYEKTPRKVVVNKTYQTFGNAKRLNSHMDRELSDKARAQGKVIQKLDDVNEEYIDCIIEVIYGPPSHVEKTLKRLLVEKDATDDFTKIEEFVEAYRSGHEVYFQGIKENLACVTHVRNLAWSGKILSYMSTYKKPFIAVGIMHLQHSEETLLDLLKQEGFAVRRVGDDGP